MDRYQDYQASDIPVVQQGGVTVRVMAGSRRGTLGPIEMRNPGLLMDVTLAQGSTFKQEVHALPGHSLHPCMLPCLPHTCHPISTVIWQHKGLIQWIGFDSNSSVAL